MSRGVNKGAREEVGPPQRATCNSTGRAAHRALPDAVLGSRGGWLITCGVLGAAEEIWVRCPLWPSHVYTSTVPNRDGRASEIPQWTIHSQRTQNGPEVAEEEGQVMPKPGTSDLPHHLLLKSLQHPQDRHR